MPCPDGLAVAEVMNETYKKWGVSKEAMFGAALKNLWEYKDYTLQASAPVMEHVLADRDEPENLLDIPDGISADMQDMLYVLTNRENIRGASVILCPRVMDKISDLFQKGFILSLLPFMKP